MILIRQGCVIDTDPVPSVSRRTDVLISGTKIVAVGPDLAAPAGATVIDARNHYVLPGFVDTHRHVWQAALRTVLVDRHLGEYLTRVLGELAPRYTSEDMYAAELAGAAECLAAGITTVADYSRPALTPELADAALTALREIGVRAVFGYDGSGDRRQLPRLRRAIDTYGSDRLTVALSALGPAYGDPAAARDDWQVARELGLRIMLHQGNSLDAMRANDLMGPDILYVHANGLSPSELNLIAETGGAVSVCPVIETTMGHGEPVTPASLAAGIPTGLGTDALTNGPGDMFSQMRAAYQSASSRGSAISAAEVLRLATIGGARALGMDDRIGSLAAGKEADLLLLRADAPGMLAAHDPIGAIVLAADTSAVDTVLVAGRIVKRAGVVPAIDTRLVDLVTAARDRLAG